MTRRPRDLPKNRRTRRNYIRRIVMNIFSLLGLKDGAFDRNPLAAAFAMAQQMPSGSGWYHRYGKCNQRRARKVMRRTVFANRRIKRGF